LIALLGWDAAHFAFTLKEDDFLDHKLGLVKPACEPLRYRAPTAPERARASAMRANLARWIPGGVNSLGQPRFAFVGEISALEPGPGWRVQVPAGNAALAAAAQRFRQGGSDARVVEVALDPSDTLGPGGFRIAPARDGARIVAAAGRGAIHALYHLRNLRQWPAEETVFAE